MAAAKTVVACVIIVSMSGYVTSSNSKTHITPSFQYSGICKSMHCKNIENLMHLTNCTVVLGDLTIVMERARIKDFANISFPMLREVTGYMIVYRVFGLQSVGSLFPNLARIRGEHLVYNFALIIYDLPHLLEIGLYNLLKVDRGGVIVWGGVLTCYMDTIHWEVITNGRRVVYPPEVSSDCKVFPSCSCNLEPAPNFCWNNKKCQRFLEGPEAEVCDSQCFGCKKSISTECTLCRHYTYKGQCLPRCPNGTIVLQVNQYCVTENDCKQLGGWSWNRACVFNCPRNYVAKNTTKGTTCQECACKQTCESLHIQTLQHVQAAEKCVYINGSLTIHIRSMLPEVLDEMRYYLSIIQEVTDYIMIFDSMSITSLDFLSSLQRIKGRNLQNGKYSLIVYGMHNLQALFTSSVTQNLIVEKGTLRFYHNPMLCVRHINKLKKKFPLAPTVIDIPLELNGYSGVCEEEFLQLKVEVKNETFAVVSFNRVLKTNINYSILYIRIPRGNYATFVPEACSELEWHAINVPASKLMNNTVQVEISSLYPASSYALCVETYDLHSSRLARSSFINFNTTVGKPKPPFIIELVASSPEVVVIRWVDHKDYRPHINYYELYVNLIEIRSEDIAARDHCVSVVEDTHELDYSRHAVVMRPPKNYEKGCESMCGILSTVTVGAMAEDYFDVCSSLQFECDDNDRTADLINSTFGRYVKTLVLNISSPRNKFQIGNLAPFRDYRFRLRACVRDKCSRSESSVVRTLRLQNADVPHIKSVRAEEPGYISIKWRPPKVTNGPVLAYNVEILPILPGMEKVIPRIYCLPGNTTNILVNFDISNKYGVRVCSTTLGSSYVCSNRRRVVVPLDVPTWWWVAFPCGIFLCISSLIAGWLVQIHMRMNDEMSLVDMTSSCSNESDPPVQMSHSLLYYVPLGKSQME